MNSRTLKALNASIAHWQDNASADSPGAAKVSSEDCALCSLFFNRDCKGCPVSNFTGATACDGTPYYGAYSLWRQWENRGVNSEDRFRSAAVDMVIFLKALLPKTKKKP